MLVLAVFLALELGGVMGSRDTISGVLFSVLLKSDRLRNPVKDTIVGYFLILDEQSALMAIISYKETSARETIQHFS